MEVIEGMRLHVALTGVEELSNGVMQEIGFLHKHYRNGPIGAIFQDTDIL